MSRVERHKNEYSKADRQAVENLRPSEDPADIGFEYGRKGAESTPAGDASGRRGTDTAVQRKGRAARNAAQKSGKAGKGKDEDLGILDQTEEEKARARKEARAMGDGRPEFHGGRVLGGIIGAIGTVILVLAIVACLGLAVPRFVGIGQYVVISGSMEPAIPIGSMVYSAQIEPSTLSNGDIIVFNSEQSGETPVTHRVVENRISDGAVITKGDANAENDPSPVPYTEILGKKVFSVPMLGYLASPMATVVGKVAMGLVIVGAYILTLVGSRMKKA